MIKKHSFSLFFLLLFCFQLSTSAQEYPKAILPGDYPDPTIVRDGKDYYMTHSPFYYMPGFLIWHSQDLMNWEPVCRILPEYTGSAMAPDLVKHNGKFYLYYPAEGTNWVSWAERINGPWSKPIDLKVGYIDPGHAVGQDGKRYLYVSKGYVTQLADDGLSAVGELRKVYDGWEYPKKWVTEGMYLESPKLTYKDGYYYMTSAEGGTAGPPTSHMVVTARSKSVLGPWENSPYNPVVHTYSPDENWWSKGHGSIVDDVNGNWWIVYHAYANGYHTLGRQTLIEPIEWTADGWYRTAVKATPIKAGQPVEHGMELSDNFGGSQLGLQWTFWKEYAPEKIALENNTLTIQAKGESPADARKLLTTATDKNYEVQVEVQVGSGNRSGLMLFYNEKAYAGVLSDGKNFTIYADAGKKETLPNKLGKRFFLKIRNQGNRCMFLTSKEGREWTVLAEDIDVSPLHHNNYRGFYALRPCLVATGIGQGLFRDFRYKNAVPTEKDMSAYLIVFHKDDTHGLYMALSTDGYSFTALNDARPVMAGDTIADQKGIRDPHIYRGPDGAFYLAMTDLHVFAQRDGLRTTEWERDGKIYGWGNNRGLVLMKSWDLIHWKRTNVYLDHLSAAYSEMGCAWAPEVTYDAHKGKLMIYFTMRFKNEPNKLYYVYVNDGFDTLESMPQLLFEYPDKKVTAIDGDITKVGNTYHLFYVSHDGVPGIKHATSSQVNRDYLYDPRWYDFEAGSCEAPNVWKRIGEEKWVLMYDCYGIKEHNFGFIETSDFVEFKNLGHFNEGVMKTTNYTSPKHGAVIHITKEEAERLAAHWKLSSVTSQEVLAPKPVFRDPVYDGAADPVVIWNSQVKKWWMFYTNRRATMTELPGVSWVFKTPLGIAESTDGANWDYVGTANFPNLPPECGGDSATLWAPDIVLGDDAQWHMYLSIQPGIAERWGVVQGFIAHLSSKNLRDWKYEGRIAHLNQRSYDADVIKMPDGTWRLYYRDPVAGDFKMIESKDLYRWSAPKEALKTRGEGPILFQWRNYFWFIVDDWKGLTVFRSTDGDTWEHQPGESLMPDGTGTGNEDVPNGLHGEILISNDRAYLYYFTHPGRVGEDKKKDTYEQRRTSIQVVELKLDGNNWIIADRNSPTYVKLVRP